MTTFILRVMMPMAWLSTHCSKRRQPDIKRLVTARTTLWKAAPKDRD
jgi:hypothetical protein